MRPDEPLAEVAHVRLRLFLDAVAVLRERGTTTDVVLHNRTLVHITWEEDYDHLTLTKVFRSPKKETT